MEFLTYTIGRYLFKGLDVLLEKPLYELYQETLEMMPYYLEYKNEV